MQSLHWGIWEENISLKQISVDWSILAFAAKWLDSPKIEYHDTSGRGVRRVRDDRQILKQIWGILDQADIVVGQNVRAFDIRKINARLLTHGFPPYSPVRVVDTMLAAKRHFAFTSNRLEWLSRLTDTRKSEHKKFPGFELWSECLADNREAWAEMRKYNIADVVATEELYLKLRPWIDGHPNVATGRGCPKCGSLRLRSHGWRHTQAGGRYRRFRCLACLGLSHERRASGDRPALGN